MVKCKASVDNLKDQLAAEQKKKTDLEKSAEDVRLRTLTVCDCLFVLLQKGIDCPGWKRNAACHVRRDILPASRSGSQGNGKSGTNAEALSSNFSGPMQQFRHGRRPNVCRPTHHLSESSQHSSNRNQTSANEV